LGKESPHLSSLLTPQIATDADEGSIIELQQLVWGSTEEATREYFQWCLKSPTGRDVSTHKVIPLPALVAAEPTLAGISVNVATHPDYRRKGLSNQVAAAIYAKAEELGIKFLFTNFSSLCQMQ